MSKVRLGFFEDFKGEDTLLFESDASGIASLVAHLRKLSTGEIDALDLSALPFIEAHHGVELIARTTARDRGAFREGDIFLWERTREGWETAAELLEPLTNSETPCHQYLDVETERDDLMIQVSMNEYGDAWWLKRG